MEKQSIILNTTEVSSFSMHRPSSQLQRLLQTGCAELPPNALGLRGHKYKCKSLQRRSLCVM